MFRPTSFSQLPEIIKNLLIINGLLFFATITLDNFGIDLNKLLALHQFQSPNFRPHQLITHFFMHGDFTHLFFNMFAIWMFGKTLENIWGAKRFLTFYIITALGAAAIHIFVIQYQIFQLAESSEMLELAKKGLYNTSNINSLRLTQLVSTPTVGASGALFGILLAFGMLFPNTLLYIYFAIPIKVKYFVIIYGALELYAGISNNPADNVAHFAHLGGMLFGYLLLKYWQKNNTQFY
jgi:membrane associated rhomboid family serine protease|tara:strand:- start:228 stop:938 length:711 start_codon:yes stop_codon:yes gene_type:complete